MHENKNYDKSRYLAQRIKELVIEVEKVTTKAPKTWVSILSWADPTVRNLVDELTKSLQNKFPAMTHAPLSRWYVYHIDSENSRTKRFLALIARKKQIVCRIRVDPTKFRDDERLTRDLRGWFYTGLTGAEKAFNIASLLEIEKMILLIMQSYNFVRSEAV